MPLPRVRFTVRRMMVAVAIVAIATGGLVIWRRSVEFRRLTASSAIQESDARQEIDFWSKMRPYDEPSIAEAELAAIRKEFEIIPPWLTQCVAEFQRHVEEVHVHGRASG